MSFYIDIVIVIDIGIVTPNYRYRYRRISTSVFLGKCKLALTDECSFCNNEPDFYSSFLLFTNFIINEPSSRKYKTMWTMCMLELTT